MAGLSNVIKISATDYATLAGGGTITKNGVTYSYDANAMYLVPGGDDLVLQSSVTNDAYRKILLSYNSGSAYNSSITNNTTNKVYYNTSVSVNTNSGALYAGSFYASSDRRLKTDIKNAKLDYLDILNKLQLKEFIFKYSNDHDNKYLGLIAQDLRDALPEKFVKNIVSGTGDKNKDLSINEGKLQYLTMGAVQQLSKIVEKQEKQINKLEQENKELKQLIKEMNKKLNKLLK